VGGAGSLVVGASAVVVCASLAGCGGSEARSARFSERSVESVQGEEPKTQTATGFFDWGAREGGAKREWIGGSVELIQQGDGCFRRFHGGAWERIEVEESASGVCALDLIGDPYTELEVFRTVAEDLREVGREQVRGVETTHYTGTLRAGTAEGTMELWVDADEVVRKRRQRDPGLTTVREYYDFGVDVDVELPEVEE
jgi:hypothetical protein